MRVAVAVAVQESGVGGAGGRIASGRGNLEELPCGLDNDAVDWVSSTEMVSVFEVVRPNTPIVLGVCAPELPLYVLSGKANE